VSNNNPNKSIEAQCKEALHTGSDTFSP